jgi:hypothetical protein
MTKSDAQSLGRAARKMFESSIEIVGVATEPRGERRCARAKPIVGLDPRALFCRQLVVHSEQCSATKTRARFEERRTKRESSLSRAPHTNWVSAVLRSWTFASLLDVDSKRADEPGMRLFEYFDVIALAHASTPSSVRSSTTSPRASRLPRP